jgi:hypothetical protein
MTDAKNGKAPTKGGNIYQRMLAVMAAAGYVQKDKRASPAAGGFAYVSHDQVVRILRPHLVQHGILCQVNVVEHVLEQVQSRRGEPLYFTRVRVEVAFVNVDNPEDRFVADGYGYGFDSQDKGPGKAVSYATKMVLLKAFLLESGEEDPEAHVYEVAAPEQPKTALSSSEERLIGELRKQMKADCLAMDLPLEDVADVLERRWQTHSLEQIGWEKAAEIGKQLRAKREVFDNLVAMVVEHEKDAQLSENEARAFVSEWIKGREKDGKPLRRPVEEWPSWPSVLAEELTQRAAVKAAQSAEPLTEETKF